MTKRAGRRKIRNGNQRHPPGKTQREPTIERDDLKPRESVALELAALKNGWMVNDPTFAKYREFLLVKAMQLGLKDGQDPKIVIAALRAVSTAELKQQQLELMAQALQLKKQSDELPKQVDGQVVGQSQQKPAYQVVQELISRKDVRNALDRRPDAASDQP